MAPTAAAKPKVASKDAPKDALKKKIGKPRNYDLGNGVMRFSRSRMYDKKALWKFVGKKVKVAKKPKKPLTIEKPIGGDKNGKTRSVLLKKRRSVYPTQEKENNEMVLNHPRKSSVTKLWIKPRPSKKCFKQHKRSLRSTLTPGTVCILLAGPHKGKRVILLKQLYSGLLLVTGPFVVNACPLRRISQRYVIGTQTKLDISSIKLPENLNDEYFRRERKKRAKKEEGDIFSTKKESYKVSEQRKSDQKTVDSEILKVIRSHPEKKMLFAYLGTMWGLKSNQYPHRMQF